MNPRSGAFREIHFRRDPARQGRTSANSIRSGFQALRPTAEQANYPSVEVGVAEKGQGKGDVNRRIGMVHISATKCVLSSMEYTCMSKLRRPATAWF